MVRAMERMEVSHTRVVRGASEVHLIGGGEARLGDEAALRK